MAKYQVDTLSGSFVFDADSEDQATRLGKDGGRIVVNVTELEPDDDPIGGTADDPSDFGDEDVIVIRQSDYDRLVTYARQGGMDGATAAEIVNPGAPVDVTEDDTPGIVAPDATTVTRPSFEPGQGGETPPVEFRRPGDGDDSEDRDHGDATPAE